MTDRPTDIDTPTVGAPLELHIEAALQQYSPSDAALAEIVALSEPILHAKDATIAQIHEARMPLKNARVAIEKTRKDLKADALAFGRAVDAEAKRLTAIVAPTEDLLYSKQAVLEAEQERLRREAEETDVRRAEQWLRRFVAVGSDVTLLSIRGLEDSTLGEMLAIATAAHDERARAAEAERARLAEEARIAHEAEEAARAKAAEEARLAAETERQQREEDLAREQEQLRADRAAMEEERLQREAAAAAERQLAAQERAKLDAEREELMRIAREQEAARQAAEAKARAAKAASDREAARDATPAERITRLVAVLKLVAAHYADTEGASLPADLAERVYAALTLCGEEVARG